MTFRRRLLNTSSALTITLSQLPLITPLVRVSRAGGA